MPTLVSRGTSGTRMVDQTMAAFYGMPAHFALLKLRTDVKSTDFAGQQEHTGAKISAGEGGLHDVFECQHELAGQDFLEARAAQVRHRQFTLNNEASHRQLVCDGIGVMVHKGNAARRRTGGRGDTDGGTGYGLAFEGSLN